MVMQPEKRYFTVEEWRAYEQDTGERYEYIDGEIYMMSGGTLKHGEIALNVGSALKNALRGKGCRVYPSDVAVQITDTKYVYPDVSALCGEPVTSDEAGTRLTNPMLVVEVVSPSSANYDRGIKAEYYLSVDSVQDYIMVDQDRAHVVLLRKENSSGKYILTTYAGDDAVVPIASLGVNLPLSEIYEGITFEEADAKSEE